MKLGIDNENNREKCGKLWDKREQIKQMGIGAAIALSAVTVLLGVLCSLGYGGVILTIAAAALFAYLIVFAHSYATIAIPIISYGAALLLGADYASAAVGLAYAAVGGVLALCLYNSLNLSGAAAAATAAYAVFGIVAVYALMQASGVAVWMMGIQEYNEYLRALISERVTEVLKIYISQNGGDGTSEQLMNYVDSYVTAIVMALPGLYIAAAEIVAWLTGKAFHLITLFTGNFDVFPGHEWKMKVSTPTAVMYCLFFAVMTVTARIESAQLIYFSFLNLWLAAILPLAATGVNYIVGIFRMRAYLKRGNDSPVIRKAVLRQIGNPVLIIVILAFSALSLNLITALAFFGVFGTIEEAILTKKKHDGDFDDD